MSQIAAKPALKRRQAEIKNFVGALSAPYIVDNIGDDDLFTSMIDLAVNEYGATAELLAAQATFSSAQVLEWTEGNDLPNIEVRKEVMRKLASLLETSDGDE